MTDYYGFRRDNDYRIYVGGDGVRVQAWYYEVPHEHDYAAETTVDPREVEPDGDVDAMIRLGLARVHTIMEDRKEEVVP